MLAHGGNADNPASVPLFGGTSPVADRSDPNQTSRLLKQSTRPGEACLWGVWATTSLNSEFSSRARPWLPYGLAP